MDFGGRYRIAASRVLVWEALNNPEMLKAAIPGCSDTLRLKRRGTEFSIMLGTNELMNSRLSGSEEALARLTIERLNTPAPRVLIGGLALALVGMSFIVMFV